MLIAAEWPRERSDEVPHGEEWNAWDDLRLRLRQDLAPAEKERLEMEYLISTSGEKRLTHRRAIKQLLFAGLPPEFEIKPTSKPAKKKS